MTGTAVAAAQSSWRVGLCSCDSGNQVDERSLVLDPLAWLSLWVDVTVDAEAPVFLDLYHHIGDGLGHLSTRGYLTRGSCLG